MIFGGASFVRVMLIAPGAGPAPWGSIPGPCSPKMTACAPPNENCAPQARTVPRRNYQARGY